MMRGPLATRRALFQAGGALVVEFSVVRLAHGAARATGKPPGSLTKDDALDAWIRIDPDGG